MSSSSPVTNPSAEWRTEKIDEAAQVALTALRAAEEREKKADPLGSRYLSAMAVRGIFEGMVREAQTAQREEAVTAYLHLVSVLAAANALIANGVVVEFTHEDHFGIANAMTFMADRKTP